MADPFVIDGAQLDEMVRPRKWSGEARTAIFEHVRQLIMRVDKQVKVFAFGSVPLKTYLPDGDIDIGAALPLNMKPDQFMSNLKSELEREADQVLEHYVGGHGIILPKTLTPPLPSTTPLSTARTRGTNSNTSSQQQQLVQQQQHQHYLQQLASAERMYRSQLERFPLHNVALINAEVKLIKCFIGMTLVDITTNTTNAIGTVRYFEAVSEAIAQAQIQAQLREQTAAAAAVAAEGTQTQTQTQQNNMNILLPMRDPALFKKSVFMHEAHILASSSWLLSSYAVETMVMAILQRFHRTIYTPLRVLWKFLHLFAEFDFEHYALTVRGPVLLSTLLTPATNNSATLAATAGAALGVSDGERKEAHAASQSSYAHSHQAWAWDASVGEHSASGLLSEAFLAQCEEEFGVRRAAAEQPQQAATASNASCSSANDTAAAVAAGAGTASFASAAANAPAESAVRSAPANSSVATFGSKFLNIVDPLDQANNLGRSVNYSNYLRIRKALRAGAQQLDEVLSRGKEVLRRIQVLRHLHFQHVSGTMSGGEESSSDHEGAVARPRRSRSPPPLRLPASSALSAFGETDESSSEDRRHVLQLRDELRKAQLVAADKDDLTGADAFIASHISALHTERAQLHRSLRAMFSGTINAHGAHQELTRSHRAFAAQGLHPSAPTHHMHAMFVAQQAQAAAAYEAQMQAAAQAQEEALARAHSARQQTLDAEADVESKVIAASATIVDEGSPASNATERSSGSAAIVITTDPRVVADIDALLVLESIVPAPPTTEWNAPDELLHVNDGEEKDRFCRDLLPPPPIVKLPQQLQPQQLQQQPALLKPAPQQPPPQQQQQQNQRQKGQQQNQIQPSKKQNAQQPQQQQPFKPQSGNQSARGAQSQQTAQQQQQQAASRRARSASPGSRRSNDQTLGSAESKPSEHRPAPTQQLQQQPARAKQQTQLQSQPQQQPQNAHAKQQQKAKPTQHLLALADFPSLQASNGSSGSGSGAEAWPARSRPAYAATMSSSSSTSTSIATPFSHSASPAAVHAAAQPHVLRDSHQHQQHLQQIQQQHQHQHVSTTVTADTSTPANAVRRPHPHTPQQQPSQPMHSPPAFPAFPAHAQAPPQFLQMSPFPQHGSHMPQHRSHGHMAGFPLSPPFMQPQSQQSQQPGTPLLLGAPAISPQIASLLEGQSVPEEGGNNNNTDSSNNDNNNTSANTTSSMVGMASPTIPHLTIPRVRTNSNATNNPGAASIPPAMQLLPPGMHGSHPLAGHIFHAQQQSQHQQQHHILASAQQTAGSQQQQQQPPQPQPHHQQSQQPQTHIALQVHLPGPGDALLPWPADFPMSMSSSSIEGRPRAGTDPHIVYVQPPPQQHSGDRQSQQHRPRTPPHGQQSPQQRQPLLPTHHHLRSSSATGLGSAGTGSGSNSAGSGSGSRDGSERPGLMIHTAVGSPPPLLPSHAHTFSHSYSGTGYPSQVLRRMSVGVGQGSYSSNGASIMTVRDDSAVGAGYRPHNHYSHGRGSGSAGIHGSIGGGMNNVNSGGRPRTSFRDDTSLPQSKPRINRNSSGERPTSHGRPNSSNTLHTVRDDTALPPSKPRMGRGDSGTGSGSNNSSGNTTPSGTSNLRGAASKGVRDDSALPHRVAPRPRPAPSSNVSNSIGSSNDNNKRQPQARLARPASTPSTPSTFLSARVPGSSSGATSPTAASTSAMGFAAQAAAAMANNVPPASQQTQAQPANVMAILQQTQPHYELQVNVNQRNEVQPSNFAGLSTPEAATELSASAPSTPSTDGNATSITAPSTASPPSAKKKQRRRPDRRPDTHLAATANASAADTVTKNASSAPTDSNSGAGNAASSSSANDYTAPLAVALLSPPLDQRRLNIVTMRAKALAAAAANAAAAAAPVATSLQGAPSNAVISVSASATGATGGAVPRGAHTHQSTAVWAQRNEYTPSPQPIQHYQMQQQHQQSAQAQQQPQQQLTTNMTGVRGPRPNTPSPTKTANATQQQLKDQADNSPALASSDFPPLQAARVTPAWSKKLFPGPQVPGAQMAAAAQAAAASQQAQQQQVFANKRGNASTRGGGVPSWPLAASSPVATNKKQSRVNADTSSEDMLQLQADQHEQRLWGSAPVPVSSVPASSNAFSHSSR